MLPPVSLSSACGDQTYVIPRLLVLLDATQPPAGREVISMRVVRPLAVAAVDMVTTSPSSPAGPEVLAALLRQDPAAGDQSYGPVGQAELPVAFKLMNQMTTGNIRYRSWRAGGCDACATHRCCAERGNACTTSVVRRNALALSAQQPRTSNGMAVTYQPSLSSRAITAVRWYGVVSM